MFEIHTGWKFVELFMLIY